MGGRPQCPSGLSRTRDEGGDVSVDRCGNQWYRYFTRLSPSPETFLVCLRSRGGHGPTRSPVSGRSATHARTGPSLPLLLPGVKDPDTRTHRVVTVCPTTGTKDPDPGHGTVGDGVPGVSRGCEAGVSRARGQSVTPFGSACWNPLNGTSGPGAPSGRTGTESGFILDPSLSF